MFALCLDLTTQQISYNYQHSSNDCTLADGCLCQAALSWILIVSGQCDFYHDATDCELVAAAFSLETGTTYTYGGSFTSVNNPPGYTFCHLFWQ